ncbi:hypothetical protein [Clostridioides sp. ZZV14-6345]|uniref:hypothetical protein n=1 Tax=Clostridioides sp. ZZV14-6345 TaxID=2811496 RepID=UPI001D12BE28|nr:hypothetical protein [Clostridioides sp. ZZV14-6345]
MATIVRLDRLPYPNPISIKHKNETPLENGAFLGIKGFAQNERECYEVEALKDDSQLAILKCSVLMHDERLDERDFVLKKDIAGRAYLPQKGEVYTIAKSHFDGDLVVGDKLEKKAATYQLTKKTTNEAVAIVRKILSYEGQPSVMIEII